MRLGIIANIAALFLAGAAVDRCAAAAPAVAPSVSLEVATSPGLPITASQKWYKDLTALGVSGLQIRAAGSRDEPGIVEQGTKASPHYKVTAILSADNVLFVPGGKFRTGDTAGRRKWLDNLRDSGAEGVTQPRAAFGLVPRQLEAATADLKVPVSFSTKGVAADSAVERLTSQLRFPLVLDAQAKRALASTQVAEDLRGLASGTALAIVLRPLGLAFVPERAQASDLQYRVIAAAGGDGAWPVGFQSRRPANKVVPRLYEFLNVEITGISVAEALEAIEGRLEVPFVFDRNAMALHGIDPAGVNAELPDKRISYSQTLRRVLGQAQLKYELRVDEAEKPFVWITTRKPAR
jgi:hypothetical protein